MMGSGERFGRESITRVAISAENCGFPRRGELSVRGFRLSAELGGGVGQVCGGRRVGGSKVDLGLASLEG